MAAPSKLANLELSVSNFGPIARADIDLRPMTVFVGPSNTGKSYLAILIYALHSFFAGRDTSTVFGSPGGGGSIFGVNPYPDDTAMLSDEVFALSDQLQKILKAVDSRDFKDVPLSFQESMVDFVRSRLNVIDNYDVLFDNEITRCLGVDDAASLVRRQARSNASVTVKRPIPSPGGRAEGISWDFKLNRGRFDLTSYLPEASQLILLMNDEIRQRLVALLYWPSGIKASLTTEYLIELVGGYIVSPLSRYAYYLPADRTGVIHARNLIIGSLINQAFRTESRRDAPVPQLPGVLTDFLHQLIALRDRIKKEPKLDVARNIEKYMLQGVVRMDLSPLGYPEFSYRPDGWKGDLPLINTSSIVSELAPVVLYLRYVVQPGDVLIIEEPESHLHPAMQVEFIRHLAAAVRGGVRIMITTHSEWVLDELANLVRVSQVPESRRNGIDGADLSLAPEQLGVWLFEPKQRPKGSVVKEIPFDEDFGGFRSGFDDVAMNTYNDYAEISNRIQESKADYRTR